MSILPYVRLGRQQGLGGCMLGSCLEGHGDLITRIIKGIIGVTIWVIGVINLLSKSP